ncbi:MAG: Gfo/Idh/MocA family oxidoreductase [Rhizobiales bacterium]|nr:Gfo/Idh/MocA family oxidoreductase [Hyphomicrobiales bacterium]
MTLNIGWIGCGRHATQMLLPQLSRVGFSICALCDQNPEALKRTASHYGVRDTFLNWEEMLELKGLDAVCIAVGPEAHHRIALEALRRGLPVFMEKPPALNHADAQEIAILARKNRLPVHVGFMKRYSSGNKIAKNILGKEAFGRILGVQATYMTAPTYFEGAVDYSGFYLHHCVHYMDLIPWLVSSSFTEFGVRKSEPAPGKLLFHLNFECKNGVIGTIVMGTVQSRGTPMEAITIMGDHQRIEINNVIDVSWFRDPPFKVDDNSASLSETVDTLTWNPNFTVAANEDHKGYVALLEDVARGFSGESTAAPTIEDATEAMFWLERMIQELR